MNLHDIMFPSHCKNIQMLGTMLDYYITIHWLNVFHQLQFEFLECNNWTLSSKNHSTYPLLQYANLLDMGHMLLYQANYQPTVNYFDKSDYL